MSESNQHHATYAELLLAERTLQYGEPLAHNVREDNVRLIVVKHRDRKYAFPLASVTGIYHQIRGSRAPHRSFSLTSIGGVVHIIGTIGEYGFSFSSVNAVHYDLVVSLSTPYFPVACSVDAMSGTLTVASREICTLPVSMQDSQGLNSARFFSGIIMEGSESILVVNYNELGNVVKESLNHE
jgi:hypothetical protein